jgi:chromosome segregation ATPase
MTEPLVIDNDCQNRIAELEATWLARLEELEQVLHSKLEDEIQSMRDEHDSLQDELVNEMTIRGQVEKQFQLHREGSDERIEELTKRMNIQEEELAKIRLENATLKETIDQLSTRLQSLETTVDKNKLDQSSTKKEIEDKFESQKNSFEELLSKNISSQHDIILSMKDAQMSEKEEIDAMIQSWISRCESIAEQVAEHSEVIDKINADMEESFEEREETYTKIEKMGKTWEILFELLEGQIQKISDQQKAASEAYIKSQENLKEKIRHRNNEVTDYLRKLDDISKAHSNQSDKLQSTLSQSEKRIEELEKNMCASEVQFQGFQLRLDNFGKDMETKTGTLKTSLDKHGSHLRDVDSCLKSHGYQIGLLETSLDQFREEQTVKSQTIDSSIELQSTQIADLQKNMHVSLKQAECMAEIIDSHYKSHIQELKVMQDSIDKLFTELNALDANFKNASISLEEHGQSLSEHENYLNVLNANAIEAKENMDHQMADLKNTKDTLMSQGARLIELVDALQASKENFDSFSSQVEQQNCTNRSIFDKIHESLDTVGSQMSTLQKDAATSDIRMDHFDYRLGQHDLSQSSINNEVSLLHANIKKHSDNTILRLDELEKQMTTVHKENEDITMSVQGLSQEHSDLLAQHNTSISELKDIRSILQDQRESISHLDSTSNSLDEKFNQIDAKVSRNQLDIQSNSEKTETEREELRSLIEMRIIDVKQILYQYAEDGNIGRDELRNMIDKLEAEHTEFAKQVETIFKNSKEKMDSVLQSVNSKIDAAQKSFNNLKHEISQQAEEQSLAKEARAVIRNDLRSILKTQDESEKRLFSHFETVVGEVKKECVDALKIVSTQIEESQTQLNRLSGRLQNLVDDGEQVKNGLKIFESETQTSIEKLYAENKYRVREIEQQASLLKATNEELLSALRIVKADKAELENSMRKIGTTLQESWNGRIEELETHAERLSNNLKSYTDALTETKSGVVSVRREVEKLTDTEAYHYNTLASRLEEHGKNLKSVREQGDTNHHVTECLFQNLNSQLENVVAHASHLATEFESVKVDYSRLERENKGLKAVVAGVREQQSKYKRDVRQRQGQLKALLVNEELIDTVSFEIARKKTCSPIPEARNSSSTEDLEYDPQDRSYHDRRE